MTTGGIQIEKGGPPQGRSPQQSSSNGITTNQNQRQVQRAEAPAVEPTPEAAPVEAAPVEAAPIRRTVASLLASAPVAERGPLQLPDRTIEGLRELAHVSLLVADSALDVPHGAEVLRLASEIQNVLARAVAGRPSSTPADINADTTPSSPAAPTNTDTAPASVEAPVGAPVEASVEAPVEAAPPKAAKK